MKATNTHEGGLLYRINTMLMLDGNMSLYL